MKDMNFWIGCWLLSFAVGGLSWTLFWHLWLRKWLVKKSMELQDSQNGRGTTNDE
jgi:hypothetical protein